MIEDVTGADSSTEVYKVNRQDKGSMTGREQWLYGRKWIRGDFEAHHAFPGALSTFIRKSENGPRASQANVLRSEVDGMPRIIGTIAKTFWVNGTSS